MGRAMRIFIVSVLFLAAFSTPAHANIVGAGTQNFNPTTDGLDYVTVQSSKTLKPGVFNVGGFLNYAVNSLPYVDSSVQNHAQLNDTLTSSDISVGVGLLPFLSAGLSFPSVIAQSVENRSGVRGAFSSTGSTEIRANVKARFSGNDDGGLAAVFSTNFYRTNNDPYAGTDPGPTYNIEFVADHSFSKLFTSAVNFGYRIRNSGAPVPGSLIEPMQNQFIASLGASYLFENIDTKLIGEIFGAIPSQSQGTNPTRNMTSAEMLLGIKHDINNKLAIHIGAGTELIQGVSSPDWRAYAGLNYTFGPAWGADQIAVVRSVPPVPETATAVELPPIQKFIVGNILFETDSAVLKGNYVEILSGLVAELKRAPFKMLSIEGHTDSTGATAYNNELSLRRADSIRDYLNVTEHLKLDRIKTAGFGPSRPIESNGNYQGRQANRRVEFTIER
jgi:outer membrane protein OmpA-like peptidoglycan-associated protein